ncbi:hypothetical protein DOK67_0002158 [Enterococcus sp. DIV0212c]|uniref:helix-turn-helix domain-containing protein n=1 Tax=Enterococcus sp. DIV0212c TaxID=2230867 RepID=UPI001A9B8ED4|nr:helix-turn-helix transcriptional regulator [Enterococcus sp. DIV0212c]MBO1354027.1 helix-turn-helix transcriptional regulator [Enterococcus sp. DIV0212c]
MNIGETLRFFRKKLHLTQKEMLDNHLDPSSYSRIEHGKQIIRIDTLAEVLNKLSLSPEEFFSRVSLDKEQKKFRALFYYCAEHLNNKSTKQKLIDYYQELAKFQYNLKERSNYIVIKVYFSQFWEEIPPLTEKEIKEIIDYLLKKDYYQQYDYLILSNTVRFFNEKQQDLILMRAIPIADEDLRDATTKNFAYNTITNLITSRIHAKDYVGARKYLAIAKKQDKDGKNYNYRMNLQYLNNLLEYLLTGEHQYMEYIYDFIKLLENIGDVHQAKILKKEVTYLTHSNFTVTNKNDFPTGLFKY